MSKEVSCVCCSCATLFVETHTSPFLPRVLQQRKKQGTSFWKRMVRLKTTWPWVEHEKTVRTIQSSSAWACQTFPWVKGTTSWTRRANTIQTELGAPTLSRGPLLQLERWHWQYAHQKILSPSTWKNLLHSKQKRRLYPSYLSSKCHVFLTPWTCNRQLLWHKSWPSEYSFRTGTVCARCNVKTQEARACWSLHKRVATTKTHRHLVHVLVAQVRPCRLDCVLDARLILFHPFVSSRKCFAKGRQNLVLNPLPIREKSWVLHTFLSRKTNFCRWLTLYLVSLSLRNFNLPQLHWFDLHE